MATDESGAAPEATAADAAEMDEESSSDSDSDIESDEEQKDSEKVREKDSKVAEFLNMGLVYCTWLFVVSFKCVLMRVVNGQP